MTPLSVQRFGRIWALASVVTIGLGLAYLYRVFPGDPGATPDCPVWALTGLKCPGCGTLRMLHHLLHGRVSDALLQNPLAFVALPVMVWFLVDLVMRCGGARAWRPTRPVLNPTVVLVVVLTWGVGRNLFP
jgi:hypothetical protein